MKKIVVFLLALICAGFMSYAQEFPLVPNDPETRVGKLDNGLTYYIRHNDKPANRAEFYLASDAGAVLENPAQDGLAHFLEHMCFNGTKNFPGKNLLNWLESIGASFGGNVNAGTGFDETTYMLTNIPLIRPTVVDSCILIMHDYSHFVLCEPSEIDAERGVILEEKRTTDGASWRKTIALLSTVMAGTKYATTSLIGSEENLKNFKPQDLVDFYTTWYRPDAQALIVVGDINVDEVEAKIKTIFADVPASENPTPRPEIAFPANIEPVAFVHKDKELNANTIEVFIKNEPMPKELRATTVGVATSLAQDMINIIVNERLNDITVSPDSPFHMAGFGISNLLRPCDVTEITVKPKDNMALSSLETALVELKKVKLYGFTDAEVERAKAEIISRYENRAKSADTRKNPQFVQPLIGNFIDGEPYMTPETSLQIVNMILPQLSAELLQQTAAQYITEENMVILACSTDREGVDFPNEAQLLETIAKVNAMEIARPEGEDIPEAFLDAKKLKGSKAGKATAGLYGSTIYQLKNGVKIVLLPTDHEKNSIRFSLVKKGGSSLIPQEDLFSFEDDFIQTFYAFAGVAEFPSTIISKMLAGKQLRVIPNITQITHGINGYSTAADLETALQLLYLNFTSPRFDENEFKQAVDVIANQLPNMETNPDFLFSKKISTNIYAGDRHHFISQEVLEKADLKTIEKNIKMLYKDAAGATFYMVGDFEIETVLPLIEKYVGSLPKGKKASNYIDHGPMFVSGEKTIEFATTMQNPKVSIFYLFSQSDKYSVVEDVNMSALSYILQMTYTNTLREQEGGTYGASVSAALANEPYNVKYLQVSCDTNVDQQLRLRELIREGISNLAANGPSDEDFDKTKKNLEKNIPERKLSNAYWLNALRNKELYNLDYVTEYEQAVEALTPAQIKAAAEALLSSGNVIEVIMFPENK